jgi:hypothetical protein
MKIGKTCLLERVQQHEEAYFLLRTFLLMVRVTLHQCAVAKEQNLLRMEPSIAECFQL